MSVGEKLQKYTYDFLLEEALARVPDTVDKRTGSIIWDALAPACYELAMFYMELYQLTQETYALTASGQWLDNRVAESGLSRKEAVKAQRIGTVSKIEYVLNTETNQQEETYIPVEVPIGSRFATVTNSEPLIYTVTKVHKTDSDTKLPVSYILECETEGTIGNDYIGKIVPLEYLPDVQDAWLTEEHIKGQDRESDEDLRERYLLAVQARAFSGNITQYREMLLDFKGVGAVQVYPVWNGGGTVLLSVVDPERLPVTSEQYLKEIQETIDPQDENGEQGKGLGLAPIDHKVTVVTPTAVPIQVEAEIELSINYEIGRVEADVKSAIEQYFTSVRRSWGDGDMYNRYYSIVYYSQVISAIVSVENVVSVSKVRFKWEKDGETVTVENEDLTLQETKDIQEIPVLECVVLQTGKGEGS